MEMIDHTRRTVLKTIPLLATLPVASLSAFETMTADTSGFVKREFTLTNLTPNTITFDKTVPLKIPAYTNSSKVKFDVSKACGAKLAPGADISFDVYVAKDSMLDVSIDEVEIKTDKADYQHLISAMNFTAQVSII